MADNEVIAADGENNQIVASGGGENNTENGAVEAGNQPDEAERPLPGAGGGFWPMAKTLLVRGVIIYMISSFFRRPAATPQTSPDGKDVPLSIAAQNLFPKELPIDMYIYINEQQKFDDFNNKDALFWLEEEMRYGDWISGENGDGSYTRSSELITPEAVMNNGSIYLHAYIVAAGNSPNPKDKERYNRLKTVHRTKQLNKFKKRKFHTITNLLTGKTEAHPDLIRLPNETTMEIISTWHPNLTINLIDDHTPWTRGAVPAPLDDFIEFEPGSNSYYPILYFNDYWNLNVEYMPINDTTKTLNITLTYSPMSLFKWQMYAAQSMRKNWYSFMGDGFMEESDEDQDSLKQTFLDTNPILLGLTIVVSIVHSVFEFLAFKNDIQFWRNRKSLEGLSVRSVFFNVFQSLIVLLYVLDNETNFVVRVSVFIGLGIEIWKIHKVVDVKVDRENKLFGVIPRISIHDKSTYGETETKKYDRLAFRYLSWALYPLLAGYAVYSLFYLEHSGWYSWVLSLMYGFLLTFGFIMMTPQLFINYKMKSVAHLPWRMLTYKALNTFIDDLFAFVIKMPTLYRIGCFRDDIVFIIYIYQRYIYSIDPKRVNEFGTSAEMLDEHGNPKPMEEITENGTAIEGPDKSDGASAEQKSVGASAEQKSDGASAEQNVTKASNKKSPKSKKEKKND